MVKNLDMRMGPRVQIDSYRQLLGIVAKSGFRCITHHEAISTPTNDRLYLLRHDVDHNIERASVMAQIEYELGVRSSYYVLPPGAYEGNVNYYGRVYNDGSIRLHERFKELIRAIYDLGHEVGIHNDFVQLSLRTGISPKELLQRQIEELRDIGIQVHGTASHGSEFARLNKFTNYEIFSESLKTSSQVRFVRSSGREVKLYDISYKELGLSYEAYDLRWNCRFADSGGSFKYSGGSGNEELSGNFDYEWFELKLERADIAIALIHPDWWEPYNVEDVKRLRSPTFTSLSPESLRFFSKKGKPIKALLRGDCTSRRSFLMNKDLFPNGVHLTINGKSPNRLFVDCFERGLTATRADLQVISDTENMPPGLRHYYFEQCERTILEQEDADLLVMDSYADMNFVLWRNVSKNWCCWVHPKFLRDRKLFEREFELIGAASLEEAIENAKKTIAAVRQNNPNIPVLFLNQQTEFCRKYDNRPEFRRMGEVLAREVDGVYFGGVLEKSELDPDDVGSSGEGHTLHFTAHTYRKMLSNAAAQGLMQYFIEPKTLQPDTTKLTEPNGEQFEFLPSQKPFRSTAAQISLCCRPEYFVKGNFDLEKVRIIKSFRHYFNFPEVNLPEPKLMPCVIPAHLFADMVQWEGFLRKFEKGNRVRLKNKAQRLGYYVKPFNWKMHIPDIHAINHSSNERSGGKMRGGYLRSIAEMGGPPVRYHEPIFPKNNMHWSLPFGVFIREEGYMQGDCVTDEKLVGYINLRRLGDIVVYSMILGHYDYLKDGTMLLLHFELLRWISERLTNGYCEGLRFVMYGAVTSGGFNLLQWKRSAGFQGLAIDAYFDECQIASDGVLVDVSETLDKYRK